MPTDSILYATRQFLGIDPTVIVTLIPITGITLPFISAGGSSLIISFAAVGILLEGN